MNITKILTGHTSPETAFVVDDYPYGFRLRCQIRYWLEYVDRRGVRLWSQTTNPKHGGAWNKPKASTFCRFGGAMFLDEENHVGWTGVTEYMDLRELLDWQAQFGAGLPEPCKPVLAGWIKLKTAYNEAKARGEVQSVTRILSPGGAVLSETVETLKPETITAPAAP